ncbi:chemotaxis protein [Rahnella sikkimica]|uniref:Chemotaxis protein n=1 Tax=Rahnella sikkimica TaxID=1805933 RepID=A0A2L1UPW2_9GAMM|nr:chemotaxis protein [Rahnella sikkimica]AVF34974.1 chemotaxis protein [Rahnella sikkimica]
MKQLTEHDIEMVNGAGWSEDINKVADRLSNFGQDAVSDTSNAVNKVYSQISDGLAKAQNYLTT